MDGEQDSRDALTSHTVSSVSVDRLPSLLYRMTGESSVEIKALRLNWLSTMNSRRYFKRLLGMVKVKTMAEFRKNWMIYPNDWMSIEIWRRPFCFE
jgi:hypothetical protein